MPPSPRARRVRLLIATLVVAVAGLVGGHGFSRPAAQAAHSGSAVAEVMPPMGASAL